MFNRSTILMFLLGCFLFLWGETLYEVRQTISWGLWAFPNEAPLDEVLFRLSPLLVFPLSFFANYVLSVNNICVRGTFQVWYRTLTSLNAWMLALTLCYWAQPTNMWRAAAVVLIIHVIVGVSTIYPAALLYTRTRPTLLFGRFRV